MKSALEVYTSRLKRAETTRDGAGLVRHWTESRFENLLLMYLISCDLLLIELRSL